MIANEPERCYKAAFGAVGKQTVNKLFRQVLENITGTRQGSDIEALHDMRVASRRMRAALGVFKECFPKRYRTVVEEEIRGITQALGQVRDQDVFVDFLQNSKPGLPKQNIRWLIDREKQIREGARIVMLNALDRFEESDIVCRVETLVEHARLTKANSKKLKKNQFGRQAYDLVVPRLQTLCSFDNIITNPEDVTGLHAMRIAAKKFRYTLEIFAPCFGEALQQCLLQLKTLQDYLGKVHDYDVWSAKLAAYCNDPGLSEKRRQSLNLLIDFISNDRSDTYNQLLAFWQNLRASGFAENVEEILKAKPSQI